MPDTEDDDLAHGAKPETRQRHFTQVDDTASLDVSGASPHLIPGFDLIRDIDDGDAAEAGPFDAEALEFNATAGAGRDAQLAVRKALTRLARGDAAEALAILEAAAAHVPEGPAREQLVALAAKVRARGPA